MKKALFLTNGKNDMVESKEYSDYIYAYSIYRHSCKIYKALAKIIIKIFKNNDFILKKVMGKWANNISKYDIIICEGLKGKKLIFEFLLKNKSKETKIIMWHWNKIFKNEINPNEDIAKKCEQWSFDPDDCEKYNFKYNTQYFSKIEIKENLEIKWDTYFLGTDKDRSSKLLKLEEIFNKMKLKSNFHIVKSPLQESNSNLSYKKAISYEENLKNVIKTKIVIDIPIEGQKGLTLRVLEALYYKRKLISFNEALKKEAFYNSNNILILNEKELDNGLAVDKIKDFMNKEYQESKENIIAREYFSFEKWMERFCDN